MSSVCGICQVHKWCAGGGCSEADVIMRFPVEFEVWENGHWDVRALYVA